MLGWILSLLNLRQVNTFFIWSETWLCRYRVLFFVKDHLLSRYTLFTLGKKLEAITFWTCWKQRWLVFALWKSSTKYAYVKYLKKNVRKMSLLKAARMAFGLSEKSFGAFVCNTGCHFCWNAIRTKKISDAISFCFCVLNFYEGS